MFLVSCVSHAFVSFHSALWSPALALVGDVYCSFVTFPCGILGQVWYLIVSYPDLCRLSYFVSKRSVSQLCQRKSYTIRSLPLSHVNTRSVL